MKQLALVAFAITVLAFTVYYHEPVSKVQKLGTYIEYLGKFNKVVPEHHELVYRLEIFTTYLQNMQKHNADSTKTWKMGINQFSDLTKEEFINTYLGEKSTLSEFNSISYNSEIRDPISPVDWRTKDVITPVKNQGKCGSCWAFAATAAHEAYISMKSHKNVSLSQQQLVDCSQAYGNNGCNGGLASHGLQFIRDNGQVLDTIYPYTATGGECKNRTGDFNIHGVETLKGCDQILIAINRTPMAVRVDASNWHSYQSGVFADCQSRWNHAVFLVAVSQDFWTIKNSWGPAWGQNGFIKLKMGDTCGVCYGPSFPL